MLLSTVDIHSFLCILFLYVFIACRALPLYSHRHPALPFRFSLGLVEQRPLVVIQRHSNTYRATIGVTVPHCVVCRIILLLSMHRGAAQQHYDAVIVGGGVAGCLLAGRLAMSNRRTLLLEEGPDIRRSPQWHRTLPCSLLAHRHARRGYESHRNVTTPQHTHRKDGEMVSVMIPTPQVLGGGGVMGGRSWLLGDQGDWADCAWDFRNDLLPRVQKLENVEVPAPHRGRRGRYTIGRSSAQSPFFKVFCEAMSKDTALTSEFNKKDYLLRSGCGRSECLVDPNSGTAHTTLQSYLMEAVALKRPVDVVCDACVVSISGGAADKTMAAGVSYVTGGTTIHVEADHVVLCAGGIGTPRLLLSSRSALHVDAASGSNFWDTPQVTMQFRTPTYLSHNCLMDPLVQALLWLNVTFCKPVNSLCSGYDDMICLWSSSGGQEPDVKFVFQPFTLNSDGSVPRSVGHGAQMVVQLLRPKSRGTINADGALDPKYLSHPDDAAVLSRAVSRIKELAHTLPLSNVFSELVAERFESAGVYGGAAHHAIDPETFLVKGTRNVYACDESILPTALSGNSTPYVLALAERCADSFLQQSPLFQKNANSTAEEVSSTRIIY
uniref:Putative choline dehydrogenase n=1 Tax=Trypanosoma vivax (strain Y486) TaxID=1055687 RepID=G0U541_TRYVY|nr:putative choline dehydrogenase [Trypanosoma vivax Y486]